MHSAHGFPAGLRVRVEGDAELPTDGNAGFYSLQRGGERSQ